MRQRQSGGRDSTNVQIETVVLGSQISIEDVRSIANDIYRANFIQFQGDAARLVDERINIFADDFIARLQREAPERAGSIADPDVQFSLLACQREYARSGSGELAKILSDLLVERFRAQTGSLRAIALNEAIATIGKLTTRQINALTLQFLIVGVRHIDLQDISQFAEVVRKQWLPFANGLSETKHTDYWHLVSMSCATITPGAHKFGKVLTDNYPGLFPRGLAPNAIPEMETRPPDLLVPLEDNAALLRFNARDDQELIRFCRRASMSKSDIEITLGLYKGCTKPPALAASELQEQVPEVAAIAQAWDETLLRSLFLTTIGISIAHCYYRTHHPVAESDLSIWIPDD